MNLALEQHILSLSNAKNINQAILEWKWVDIRIISNSSCPCGKKPIKENCVLENKLNNNITKVGNVCVNQFIGINTGNVFSGLNRIINHPTTKNPNKALIDFAYSTKAIDQKEHNFLNDIRNKRNLSTKQKKWRNSLNKKLISIYE